MTEAEALNPKSPQTEEFGEFGELKTKKILKITAAPDSIKKLYKEIANIVIVSSMPNYSRD